MDINNLTVNYPKLKRYISATTAKELSMLVEPCYYPKTKRFLYELLNILNVTEKDFKNFVKEMYRGTKAANWPMITDVGTNSLVVVMYLFLKNNDMPSYRSTMTYYMIVQYARLIYKHFQFCSPDTFKYALDNITKTHLFYREKTIANSLFYLANEADKRFMKDIKEWDIDKIISFIGISRHRISQSIKSFAETYYHFKKQGIGIKTQVDQYEDEEGKVNSFQQQTLQRGQRVIDNTLKNIFIYKTVDRKALEEAKNISKIKTSIATLMVDKLANPKNENDVKIILQLFLKNVEFTKQICGKEYYDYVKRMMSIKRSNATVYFKSQVNILLMKVIDEMGFKDIYNKYTIQTQFTINTFLAFYLTLLIRTSLCSVGNNL